MLSKTAVHTILDNLNWTDIPKSIAHGMFPISNTPAAKWSLANKVIMASAGTLDARGRKQWQSCQRYLIKGAKPFYIIAPQVSHQDHDKSKQEYLRGYLSIPVYAASHTYGDDVEYDSHPEGIIDIREVSKQIHIKSEGTLTRYELSTYFNENIELAGEREKQFCWQVCLKLFDSLNVNSRTQPERLLVAELAALALLYLIGRNVLYCGKHYSMIQKVAQELRYSTMASFLKVMKSVQQVLDSVLDIGLCSA